MHRRLGAVAVCAVLLAALAVQPPLAAKPAPFAQGVAASATTTDAILWTRAGSAGRVHYDVATDNRFRHMVVDGAKSATAAHDFTVKPVVRGLDPDHRYYYRFKNSDGTSDVGTFRTLPNSGPFTFSVTGDSDSLWVEHPDGQDKPFDVLNRVAETNPDLLVYLGDTIYSDTETLPTPPPALTIQEKWQKHRANRVAAARNVFRKVNTLAQWDDHEVINDYDGAVLAQTDPALLAAGQNAFFDYWPVPTDPTYREILASANSDMFLLDERTFRSQSADEADSPCRDSEGKLDLVPTMPEGDRAALELPPVNPDCLSHIFDPTRTMLGAEQLSWIEQGLLNSTSQWKFVISEVPITQYFAFPYDGWEGYSYERNQLLSFIQDNDIKNVVFLATDVHANWAARVYEDIGQDHTPIAYEVASGPIQTCTLGCEADRLLGAGGGDNLLQFEKFRGLIDVDCADIDTYAYSTTTVPANAQSLHMVWRTNKKAKSGGGKLLAGCDEQLLVDTLPQH